MFNRHIKTQNTYNVTKGRYFTHFKKILQFLRFLEIISSTCKPVENILCLLERGRRTRQYWINLFCDDRYFMTAMHFRFQCETLKINFTKVSMIF